MIYQAFIQEQSNGKLGEEEQKVVDCLTKRGIAIKFYTEKRIHRRQLPLNRQTLVVGDVSCIHGALKQLSIPIPPINDYPNSLQSFLHRRIWQTTLGQLESRLVQGNLSSVFIKPANRRKRFTGFVVDSEYDLSQIYGVSRQEKIFCSEIVNWVSEYRVYVVNSEIKNISFYAGDPKLNVDRQIIKLAIKTLDDAKESYAGYAIDFGVLDSGQTALIEMNEGYAIGAYSINSEDYTNLILSRWLELLNM